MLNVSSYANLCISVSLTNLSTELEFISDRCDIVHGNVSMNNVVIVRLLPNILASIPAGPASGPDSATSQPRHTDNASYRATIANRQ